MYGSASWCKLHHRWKQYGTTNWGRLGLSIGGRVPWVLRYPLRMQNPVSPLFNQLQDALGYQFRCGTLLLEAVTHPSFKSTNPSDQRLEWVGDGEPSIILFFLQTYRSDLKAQLSLTSWSCDTFTKNTPRPLLDNSHWHGLKLCAHQR